MATPEIIKNARVEWGGSALGNVVSQVEINGDTEVQDATGFTDTSRVKVLGFNNWSMTITFKHDYAAAGFNKMLYDAWVAQAPVTLKVRKSTAAIGTTNPEFVGDVLITRAPLFNAQIGQVSGGQITLEGTGTLARNVA